VIAVLLGAACDGSPTVLQAPGIRLEHTAPVVQQAVALVDAHRATLGCEPLKWHMQSAWVGEMYARQMSDEGFFGHVDTLGRNLKFRLTNAGIHHYRTAAETIAAGQATGDRVVTSWLASPDHREILEDCRYTHMGLGFHRGAGPYRDYWTAVFLNVR
jgi:uncharacterized protein YkwD